MSSGLPSAGGWWIAQVEEEVVDDEGFSVVGKGPPVLELHGVALAAPEFQPLFLGEGID